MKMSLKWLNEFIDLKDLSAQAIAERLTSVGFEVEGVEDLSKNFDHVVIGKILEKGQHPNADRLSLCKVDVGGGVTKQIVCGAKNHKALDHVVVAMVGAVLPGNFEIKLSKIRDVESQGMLCSEKELGLLEDSEGIMILDSSAPVGQSFANYMGKDDVIFDLKVYPNRSDALSHFGLARELTFDFNRPLKQKISEAVELKNSSISLNLKEPELCPRYAGLQFKNIKVAPSPQWLKTRLQSVDINSVNNVVDITNFVMMELGQPLHAFDLAKLTGQQIEVSLSTPAEVFTSFDGSKINLSGEELMIKNKNESMVIAGVIGSPNSGISNDTTEIFIEAAHFVPQTVRKTSRKLGIETDSAYRFSRGTDADIIPQALARTKELLEQICHAQCVGGLDQYPKPKTPHTFLLDVDLPSQKLGYPISKQQLIDTFKNLNCKIEESDNKLKITAPLYRADLEEDVDAVEEFGRLNGFDKIPEHFPKMLIEPSQHAKKYVEDRYLRSICEAEGFSQVINYAFVNKDRQLDLIGEGQEIPILNPLSEEYNVMRRSLLTGMIKNVLQNLRYGVGTGRIFELGSIFNSDQSETRKLSLIAFGNTTDLWNEPQPPVFVLKSVIENLCARLKIGRLQFVKEDSVPSLYHPAQTVSIKVEGRRVGLLGTMHPARAQQEKIKTELALCDLDLDQLMVGQPRATKIKSLSLYPAVERDLSFLVPLDLPTSRVEEVIRKNTTPYLQHLQVVKIFVGDNMPQGVRSLSYRMILQDAQSTLSEETLMALQNKVIAAVQNTLGVAMR